MISNQDQARQIKTNQVSIIVAARNNARHLEETLRSAFGQTVPCEVIYADDASLDDSLAIAAAWESRGLVIVRQFVHRGVCATRNLGATVARGDLLLFLDGDDRLPKGYVARHLEAMTPETPFVYGPARAFGEGLARGHALGGSDWPDYDRWRCNTVNTSALYARWAFQAAGG
ncbi:MAG: glycosyltransferase [Planctomycetaceae bacterium]